MRLLSAKSKSVCEKKLKESDNKQKRGMYIEEGAFTEEVLLSYFFCNGEERFATSIMWTKYSMLKSILNVHKVLMTSKYGKLTPHSKVASRNYKPKKANILEINQIEEFLIKASYGEYLQGKVENAVNTNNLYIELCMSNSLQLAKIMGVASTLFQSVL